MTEYWIRDSKLNWKDNWQTQGDYTERGMKSMVKKHLVANNCNYGKYIVEVMQGSKGQLDNDCYSFCVGYLNVDFSKKGITIEKSELDEKQLNSHSYREVLYE